MPISIRSSQRTYNPYFCWFPFQVIAKGAKEGGRRPRNYDPMTVLIVVSEPPHGSDRPYHALRLAGALQVAGHHVRVFLMSDAVWTGAAGQSGANADTNLAARLGVLLESGVEVKACGLCVETRGLQGSAMVPGIQSATLPDLAEWVTDSDRVLTF